MKLAVFEVYHQFQYEILELLIQKGIEIEYYISGVDENFYGDSQTIKRVKEKYLANVSSNVSKDFLLPEDIMKLNNSSYHLSNDLLKEYSDIEVLFLKITDRATAKPTSVHTRRKYYHTILNHFIDIVNKKHFDAVLCFDTPHSLQGSVLYELLQRKEIKALRLEHTYFLNYSLLLGARGTPSIPDQYLKNSTTHRIKENIPTDILNNLGLDNEFVEKAIAKEKRKTASTNVLGRIKLLRQFLFKYVSNIIIGIFPFLYKKHLRHFTSFNSIKSELVYRLNINKRVVDLYKLNRFYLKNSVKPDMDEKYIYFGLHMQPEKTTLPMGRNMDHHLTSIMILSKSLPQGWKLYVKEHPNQFNLRKVVNANFRDELFYKTVKNLPNTSLISLDTSSRELIRKAQISSTTTGTVGWESILAGKTAIVFGDAYYGACRAVRTVESVDSCKQAIKELVSMNSEDVKRELYRYLSYYIENNILIKGTNWETKFSYSNIGREELITSMAESIYQKLKN